MKLKITNIKSYFIRYKYLVFAVVFLILLCNFVIFVRQNIVDIPFWDEWDVADNIMQKGNWADIAVFQHNEHRIGTGLVLMKILAPLTNWSQSVEVGIVSALIIMSCFLMLWVKKKITGRIELLDLSIPLIFLNVLQWGNILFAFQITFVFPLLFLCLGLWALTIKDLNKRNFLIVLFSLLGTFSSFHGLFIPTVFIFFLIVELFLKKYIYLTFCHSRPDRESRGIDSRYLDSRRSLPRALTRGGDDKGVWKMALLAILAEILVMAAYFLGYEKKFQTALSLKPNFQTLDFFTAFLANGFFYHADVSQKYGLRYFLAALTALALAYGLYRLAVLKKNELASWIGVLLIVYSFLFAFSITLGRSAFGIAQASETRYITFSMLAPLGIYFVLENFKRKNWAKFILAAVLLGGLFSYPSYIGDSVAASSQARKDALQCYKTTQSSEYDACFKIAPLYPSEERLRSLMPSVLKYKKIGR